MRELVYYVAVSVDGYIADKSGDFSAFPQEPETLAELFEIYPETCPTQVRDLLGVEGPARRFDTVLMGARTHQPALAAGLTSAYPHLRQLVVTHRSLPADPTVERVQGAVSARVTELKAEAGMDIWLCGGGDLAGQLQHQIDELHLKVNPVVLGAGIPLFHGSVGPTPFRLVDSQPLAGGVLLNRYRRPAAPSGVSVSR